MDISEAFKILGIERSATPDEVKQAYRDLVAIYHPDRYAHNPRVQAKAQEQLKQINLAYETLQQSRKLGAGQQQSGQESRRRWQEEAEQREYERKARERQEQERRESERREKGRREAQQQQEREREERERQEAERREETFRQRNEAQKREQSRANQKTQIHRLLRIAGIIILFLLVKHHDVFYHKPHSYIIPPASDNLPSLGKAGPTDNSEQYPIQSIMPSTEKGMRQTPAQVIKPNSEDKALQAPTKSINSKIFNNSFPFSSQGDSLNLTDKKPKSKDKTNVSNVSKKDLKSSLPAKEYIDLTNLTSDEKYSIDLACTKVNGPAVYNACVEEQLGKLRSSGRRPDISMLTSDEKYSIDLACTKVNGPAVYNACVEEQLGQLRSSRRQP
jgi:curved DNA-binding protein CbpA